MDKESKPNPELQRIAELLRPLWPGIVFVASPKYTSGLSGRAGKVHIEARVSDGEGACMFWFEDTVLCSAFWQSHEETAKALKEQRDRVRGMADLLNAALGLEVSDA